MFNLLKQLRKNTLWVLQFFVTILVSAWVASLAIYAIGSKIYPKGVPIINDVRCAMGIPSQEGGEECIQAAVERARVLAKRREAELEAAKLKVIADGVKKQNQLEKDHAVILAKRDQTIEDAGERERKLRAAQDKSAALIKRIKDLENKWTDINLFSTKTFKGTTVTSGVKYASLVKGKKYSSAWCYWDPGRKDIPVHLSLGQTGFFGVSWQKYSDTQLEKSGVTRDELEAVKQLCQWPQTS